jgi:hypothetical protein
MRILLLLLLFGLARPLAAEPVFVPGSSIGIEPPPGFVPDSRVTGFFRDASTGGSMQLAEMPAIFHAEMWQRVTANVLPGWTQTAQRSLRIAAGEALLIEGRHPTGTTTLWTWRLLFSDGGISGLVTVGIPEEPLSERTATAVLAALQSVVVRRSGLAVQRAALAYTFEETPGLRFQAAMDGGIAILAPSTVAAPAARAPARPPSLTLLNYSARLFRARPPRATAEAQFRNLPGYGDVAHVAVTEPAVAGLPGVRIEARATRTSDGSAWRLVQWMGFLPEGGGYIRAFAEAPEASFDALAPEFEQVVASLRRR